MWTPVQLNKLFEFALNILSNSTKVTVDKRFVPFKIVQREVNTQNGWQKDSRRMGSQKDIFKRNFYTTKKSNYLRIMFPLAIRSQSFNSVFKSLSKRILKFHFFLEGTNCLYLIFYWVYSYILRCLGIEWSRCVEFPAVKSLLTETAAMFPKAAVVN